MKILDRYIFKQLIVTTILALFAFVVLYGVFEMVAEAKEIGRGNFTQWVFLQYITLRSPLYMYQIFPVAVLIGAMLTFARLSLNSEYAVMRASGMSSKNLLMILGLYAVIMTLFISIFGDTVLPPSVKKSQELKTEALYGNIASRNNHGIWVKTENDFAEIGFVESSELLHNVTIYESTGKSELKSISKIRIAQYVGNGVWKLIDVHRQILQSRKIVNQFIPEENKQTELTPNFIKAIKADSQEMSLLNLYRYIEYLKDNHQSSARYEVDFWKKIFYPFVCLAMVLIAYLFTPILSRHSNIGWRIFVAMLVGVLFHFVNNFFGFYALIFHVPAVLAAILPSVIFLIVPFIFVAYQRKKL